MSSCQPILNGVIHKARLLFKKISLIRPSKDRVDDSVHSGTILNVRGQIGAEGRLGTEMTWVINFVYILH